MNARTPEDDILAKSLKERFAVAGNSDIPNEIWNNPRALREAILKFSGEVMVWIDHPDVSEEHPHYEILRSLKLAMVRARVICGDDNLKFAHTEKVSVGTYGACRYLGFVPEDAVSGLIVGLLHDLPKDQDRLFDQGRFNNHYPNYILKTLRHISSRYFDGNHFLNFIDSIGLRPMDLSSQLTPDQFLSWVFTWTHEKCRLESEKSTLGTERKLAMACAIEFMESRIHRACQGEISIIRMVDFLNDDPVGQKYRTFDCLRMLKQHMDPRSISQLKPIQTFFDLAANQG